MKKIIVLSVFVLGLLFTSQNGVQAMTVYKEGCTATTAYSGKTGEKCPTGNVLGLTTSNDPTPLPPVYNNDPYLLPPVPYPDCSKASTPSITVLSPNGGEVYQAGQQITVKWSTCNVYVNENITLGINSFEPNNMGGYSIINTTNDGSEVITLPNTSQFGQNPGQYHYGNYFKIYAAYLHNNQTQYIDYSDNLFTINGPKVSVCATDIPSITVLSPNGGEFYLTGGQIGIKWRSCNIPKDAIIYLNIRTSPNAVESLNQFVSTNDGYESVILSSIVTPGTYYMQASLYNPTTNSYSVTDFSDNFFTIGFKVTDSCTSVSSVNCGNDIVPMPPVPYPCKGASSTDDTKPCVSPIIGPVDYSCLFNKYSTNVGEPCSKLPPVPAIKIRTLRPGSRGDDVKALQEWLNIKVDGVYGRGTAKKVKEWQLSRDLKPDGLFGSASREKIDSSN